MANFTIYTYMFKPIAKPDSPDLFVTNAVNIQESLKRKQELLGDIFPRLGTAYKASDISQPGEYSNDTDKLKMMDGDMLYLHKMLVNEGNIIAFRIANNKKIMRHTAKFTDEEFDDHPSCLVVIDNRHDRQLIAIEQKQKSFSSTHTVAKILTATFNRYLAPYRLTLTIDAKYHENEFWKIIDTYPKGFKRAEFTFPYPNLPVISMLVSETMNQEAREFHCEPTQVLRALDSQVLDLNKDSERLQAMVSACAASGKPILLLPVSKRKVIKCNTDKTVVTEEMSLAEIDKLTSSDLFHSAFSALTDFVNRIKAKYE